ncbi:DUF4169 family protein [Novosphingobium pituita]|uniref:DUF4169 family protein n=1 Tax=Novosphingobium pituita TaxID=3056842 RepID=A0ABQ6P8M1_9SPHN|nr:DUF4169 family protein [Novosphingobium sp. IK01]MDK4805182.1 DUF4169 family protein [Novosphingobium aromaticivorans]GMM60476.1 DUF4169 family protein [Novosphingobium sp. IK01]
MAQVINLRMARKARARREAEVQAATNRALHGRTKAEKAAQTAARDKAERHVEGHRLEGQSPEREPDAHDL